MAISTDIFSSFKNRFLGTTSVAPLVTVRILFGALVAFSTLRFLALGWAHDHFICADFHFKYYGFEWVSVPGAFWVYALHGLLVISSVMMVLGLFYRYSATATFLLFTYIQLWDATYYLNHYYFISLFAFLLIFVPAHRSFSLDAFRTPTIISARVATWTVNILKLQLAIVYIYAGITKINTDWLLEALPLKIWLPSRADYFLLGNLFQQEWVAYVFSWAGMLYDLLIVFFLLNKRTRVAAFLLVVVFHLLTRWLFPIGVFPFVMILMTLIFFSDNWHQKMQGVLRKIVLFPNLVLQQNVEHSSIQVVPFHQKIIALILVPFFIFQLVFPLRSYLYADHLFWKEQGYRFSWRVMLMEKAGDATFYVKEKNGMRKGEVFNNDFLTAQQQKQLAFQPDFILQYAKFLKHHYKKQGMTSPEITAQIYVTLNGRPSKLFVDSAVDLSKINDSWASKKWVTNYPF